MAGQAGNYRGASAAERAGERRERLLEATLAVWAEHGSRVTMTRVCAAAGLTERYFYESFGGLDEALTAVMDAVADEIERASLASAAAAADDPTDRVRASVQALLDVLAADPRKARVVFVEAAGVPALRARRTALLRHFAHRAATEAGEIWGLEHRSAAEAEVVGLLFVGGLAELVMATLDGQTGAFPADPGVLADTVAELFVRMHAPVPVETLTG